MKKRTLKLAALSLMMTAMLFNCKDDDKTSDPTEPDAAITKELLALDMPAFTATPLPAIPSTAGAIVVPAKATELSAGYASIATTGVIPASVTEANAVLTAALSPSEMSTLSSVSPETIAAINAGGVIPADIKAIVDKAYGNASLAAYLPTVTAPTVNNVAITATRTGSTDAVEKIENSLLDDACTTKANNDYNTAKAKIDASNAGYKAAVATAFATNTTTIATGQSTCVSSATTSFATQRTAAGTTLSTFLAFANANQAALGDLYASSVVSAYLSYFALMTSINTLETESKLACTAIATAQTAAAASVQTADLATLEVSYKATLVKAAALRDQALLSCHNEGSGN